MPPKVVKKSSAKKNKEAGAAANKTNWEAGLTRAPFEEDSWKASVSIVAGDTPGDEELIQALALAVQRPQRKLFTVLTWDSTVLKVHELGNPKAKKNGDVPMFYEVTQPAKVLLDAGEEIPCDLIAKILKFQLLEIKVSDQKRRAAEQTAEERTKASSPTVNKVSDKKGSSPVQSSKEKKTKLKRRGDDEPPKFIEDEPDDGPQHYILVLGFYHHHLIGFLDAIGVHVANVIKLCSARRLNTAAMQQEQETSEGNELHQSISPLVDTDSVSVEQVSRGRRLGLFWSGLRSLWDSTPLDSQLHNVAQLTYTVPDLTSFHPQDPASVLELGSRIFEGVANLIYDSLNWRWQHQHYIDNIRFLNIPTVVRLDHQPTEVMPNPLSMTLHSKKSSVQEESPPDQESELPPLSTDVDMRFYSSLLNQVPPEACSVPLILHCMLEQVVISTEQSDLTPTHMAENNRPQAGPLSDRPLVGYMLQRFLPLVRTEEQRSHMFNSLLALVQNEEDKKILVETYKAEETQKSEDPLVIRHHDKIALRLRDINAVQCFDPAEVEWSMMKLSPVWELIHSLSPLRKSSSCRRTVKQQLQHYCIDDVVAWPDVERLFHQSVFETMPLTTLDQNGVLLTAGKEGTLDSAEEETPTIIPWDNPESFAKQQLHNLQTKDPKSQTNDHHDTEQVSGKVSQHLDLSDIQSCRLRSLFDWHYAEHHNASVLPQVLQLASEEYLCLDTFTGRINNVLYIFCHSPRGPQYQSQERWDVALHTDVKFRKYLENVADIISDWTREEELKKLKILSWVESPKDENDTDSGEEEETLEPIIRKDSLKAWKLEQERLKEEEMARKSKKENTPKDKKQREEARTMDNKSSKTFSGVKKSRGEKEGSSLKSPTESISTTVPPVEENKELHQTEEPFSVKGFTGYRMDGKLIHVSGHLQYLFPSDGGRITVENISYVEGSSLMKVALKKDGHNFYTHINRVVICPTQPPTQPHDKETNVKNENYKVPEPLEVRRVKQGSLSAVLNNGIHLSYSFYGPTGECKVSTQETEGGTTFVPISSPTQQSKETELDSVPFKKHTSHKEPQEPQLKVCEGQPALPLSSFHSLSLSVPNGLLLQFLREDIQGVPSEELGVLVRQSFPLYGMGEAGELQDQSLSKELSRIVTSQGTVIRYMRDSSTEVLFADGSVSSSQDCGPVWVAESEVEEEDTPKETEDDMKEQSTEEASHAQRGCWLTTTPSGARICTVGTTHKRLPTTPLLTFKATDPITHEVMLSREDLVVSVQRPDGALSVEHADGTRITSLYQERQSNTGVQDESVTLKSTRERECRYAQCVTPSTNIIRENMHPRKYKNILSQDGVGCLFADKTVAENNMTSTSESGKESVSNKERVLLVEKEGCATVVMYPERHMAYVLLADGTAITGNNHGAYQVFPSSVGLLQIQSDGKCVYSSDPHVTRSPKDVTPTNQPESYTFSHTDRVACDITDSHGNHFQVMDDGQISVLNFSPSSSTLKQEDEEEDRGVSRLHEHRERCPRLFLVHEDGSGTELLSSQSVEELLYKAYSDPTIVVRKEPLPDTQDEFCITILKPSHQSVWYQWLLGKQKPDIIPPNLRNRTWHDFNSVAKKSAFGINMGRGLTLRDTGESAAQPQPVSSHPKVLEMRELYQHRPFTMLLKNTIDTRLKIYIERLIGNEQHSEDVKVKDPRTEEETVHAADLLSLVLSFPEGENPTHDKMTSVDIASLYSDGVGAQVVHSDLSENTATSHSLFDKTASKWTERLANYRQELCEEKACRMALRKKNIVPYFHLENFPLHQKLLQNQTQYVRSPSRDLPPIAKSDSAPKKTQARSKRSLGGLSGSCRLEHVEKPRRAKVRRPTSILNSNSCNAPDQQCLSAKEQVKRKCQRSTLTDPHVVRGFRLLPSRVDFGTVQEGTPSTITVVMKNVGVHICRFHVKQPQPATGVRVIYNPGPVAAGMQVKLQVQLFAMYETRAGEAEPQQYISQDIVIRTETDILYLPVTATILPKSLHEVRLKDHKNTGSRVLELSSSLPPGKEVIHRRPNILARFKAKKGNAGSTTG